MVVVNQGGEIVLLNVQAESQFGYSRDELLGQKVKNIIPEGFAERLIADGTRTAAEALAQQIGTGIELSARRKDGTEFPIEIMLSPLESAEGILVTAAIRDISVRKAAEEHLAQMEGRYRGLLEAAPDAMVVVNQGGEIVLLNAQAENQFGYSRDELLGQKVKNIIPEGFAERLIADGTRTAAAALAQQIGTGIEQFDVAGFGARYAYTVDGGTLGEISDETWSARLATVTFHGRSVHPGTAKGVMVNAIYAFAHFLSHMPHDMLPETTDGRIGFVHPYLGKADVEESSVKVLLRDFELPGLAAKEKIVRDLAAAAERAFPGVTAQVEIRENYQNMKEVLKDYPQLAANAMEAARRAGLEPFMEPIRGGTDGSRLTFRGLPCPNIFTGGHNFHGKQEFNSRRGLEKTTEMLVHLVQIFAEQAAHSTN